MISVVVAAFPQDAAKIIVIDKDKQEKQDDVMCWAYEIIPNLMGLVGKYDDVESITFLGPRDYVEPFAANAAAEFPNIKVEVGEV